MVSVIVQVVIVEHTVQTRMVNIFVRIIMKRFIFLVYFLLRCLIYVIKLFVKTMEFVLFECKRSIKVFVSVDMATLEIIVN